MKAVITKQVSNAVNYSGQKEVVSCWSVMGKVNGELREVVSVRCYMGRSSSASKVYAALWVNAGPVYTSGRGSAGGYGYHKESAAVGDAIASAGIELYGDVYDRGYQWNHAEKRENTPSEIRALKRKAAKTRAHIGGVGESAIRSALEAIARAAGAKGKLLTVSHG